MLDPMFIDDFKRSPQVCDRIYGNLLSGLPHMVSYEAGRKPAPMLALACFILPGMKYGTRASAPKRPIGEHSNQHSSISRVPAA
jgi:hypothetical protein